MKSKIGQPGMQQASFADFEAYENSFQGWSPTVRKLDARPFAARLLQLSVGSVRMAYSQLDARIAISGVAQPGLSSFGIPMPGSRDAMWCRQVASSHTLSVYDRFGTFDAVTPPGFETVVFSIEPHCLAEMGESLGYETPADMFPLGEVTRGHDGHMRGLHRLLGDLLSGLAREPALALCAGVRETLERDIPLQLLRALAENAPIPKAIAPHLRQRALRRALDYIAQHPRDPLGVQELCRATGASERTLRRGFLEELGIGPKTYLQSHRLNGTYRELRHNDAGETRVTEVAHRWGFWHMGQFAADYRRLFGELPSATLSRDRDAAGAAFSR